MEALIPDFGGNTEAIARVALAHPTVLAHDIQTIPRLYPAMRPGAIYERSLALLSWVATHFPNLITKAALLVGLGEDENELKAVLQDLAQASVKIVVIGQYIQPRRESAVVARYWTPQDLAELAAWACTLGMKVYAAPLARSSHKAAELSSSRKLLA